MPVGDVERRQGIDRAGELGDLRVVIDHPKLMAHAAVGGDIDLGRARSGPRHHGVDRRRGRIAHHHRPGLGVDRLDLADAVVLLERGGVLVLADPVGGVIGERGDAGEPGLLKHASAVARIAAAQSVDIIARFRVADHDASRNHAREIFGRLVVDSAIVGVGRRIEINLGLGDMKKAPRLALGARACLSAGEHVIRRRQNFGSATRRGTECAEGLDEWQTGISGVRW